MYLEGGKQKEGRNEVRLSCGGRAGGGSGQYMILPHLSEYKVRVCGAQWRGPSPPMTEGWSEGHWPEGMHIVLGADYDSFLISFWDRLLVL